MAPRTRVIIDTDPGVDDILALLLAFSASPEEIEVLLISVVFGNVDVQLCLRNVVSMFHVISKEMAWRREQGIREGFDALKTFKPVVAAGAKEPLGDPREMAAYFHGVDGLGGVHTTHPHHTCPEDAWKTIFDRPPAADSILTTTAVDTAYTDSASSASLFTPSNRDSHLEILRILDENPAGTITIIAIGPLTNLALAASHSLTTFLRAKSVLVMGGAISAPGNATPVAEFNTLADPTAAARIFALSSPNPESTMPPTILPTNRDPVHDGAAPLILPPYQPKEMLLAASQSLRIILFPLDLTEGHTLRRDEFERKTHPLVEKESPLAEWTNAFLSATFRTVETLHHGQGGGGTSLSLHDPLCVWYALNAPRTEKGWSVSSGEDIRVETTGQWTKGMCVIDRRSRKMEEGHHGEGGVVGDKGGWLTLSGGNRVSRCVRTPGERALAPHWMEAVFGK